MPAPLQKYGLAFFALVSLASFAVAPAPADELQFERDIRPLLERRCFACHAHGQEIKSGLVLDSLEGIATGGKGGPVIVAGKPEESRLILAVRRVSPTLQMPPDTHLPQEEIVLLAAWIAQGAKELPVLKSESDTPEWQALYEERLKWWSLQPLQTVAPPAVADAGWPRNEVDPFILAALEAKQLHPAPEAERRTLARRLSFALTGLPPDPKAVEAFVADGDPNAYEALVDGFLASPHYGERWARHWMDVVHYADTHGYEWDVPAKDAWRYRDYLIDAFNEDLPYRQLILEQLAGDLVAPRVDPQTSINQALIGPMALRLGERRHGDNADAEGISQEAVANVIDTVGKGFLATTVACAQCHDHKLDAVAQRDYYGLAGMLMSTRWTSRTIETRDPNERVIAELKAVKETLRDHLGQRWAASETELIQRILATPPDAVKKAEKNAVVAPVPFPDSLPGFWKRLTLDAKKSSIPAAWEALASEFAAVQAQRVADNQQHLTLVADFTQPQLPEGWQTDGLGMKYGLVKNGELVVAEEGDVAVAQLLPAGRWSHVYSKRLAAALRSPLFPQEPAPTISLEYAGGQYAAESMVVDIALHSERMKFLDRPWPSWLTLATGNLPALANDRDDKPRRVYLELVTKALNNYYPPRDAFGGLKQSEEADERSWFGVTRMYQHAEGKGPGDALAAYTQLLPAGSAPTSAEEAAHHFSAVLLAAVEHWRQHTCSEEDVRLINDALSAKWLPNEPLGELALAGLVAKYRETEKRLQPDPVVGSVEDWREGQDERLAIRGSYTDLGESVPRGNIGFLGGPSERAEATSSGRLEFARGIASDSNPLTARVYVNRVWHWLFGEGLVRTVDDFGHLGEQPSHPELLDWLAARFMQEGWSTKKLVKLLVMSATWRQGSSLSEAAHTLDPENRLWHHLPMRRLEAEEIRDAMLAVSGRLDAALYGPPINPYRVAQDSTKRLYSGPLDGEGRRSIYQKMTLMEPPRFLALFNQPIPKLTTGRRDSTNVPDQALALLNDPFVVAMAEQWSDRLLHDGAQTPEERVRDIFASAFGRPPHEDEIQRMLKFVEQSAALHGAGASILLQCQPVWQDVAHSVFNLKEFIYVQ